MLASLIRAPSAGKRKRKKKSKHPELKQTPTVPQSVPQAQLLMKPPQPFVRGGDDPFAMALPELVIHEPPCVHNSQAKRRARATATVCPADGGDGNAEADIDDIFGESYGG